MKKVISCLFSLIIVFLCISYVMAAVTETQSGSTVTMDGVTVGAINSRQAWRSTNYDSFKIEDDGTESNIVMKIPNNTMLAYTSFSGNAVKKGSVMVYLTDTEGKTDLFRYVNNFSVNYPEGTSVTLKNGGAYVYDVSGTGDPAEICFIQPNTLTAGYWYRVERIFDFRAEGINKQRAFVYNASGTLIGASDWTVCGTVSPHASYGTSYPTVFFECSGYTAEAPWIDDVKLFNLTVTDITADVSFSEENRAFEIAFGESMNDSTFTKDSVILSVDNDEYDKEIKYSISYSEATKKATVSYEYLPPNEAITLKLKKSIENIDGWGLTNEIVKNYTTSQDKFRITAKEIKSDNGTYGIVTFKNEDTMPRDYIILLIKYDKDKNKMTGVKAVANSIAVGNTPTPVTTPAFATLQSNEEVKLYIIDNWKDLKLIREE